MALDQALDVGVRDPARPERLDGERDRPGDPDAVRDLDLEPVRQPGRDDVLRDPSRRIGAGSVDLRRVLAGDAPPPWRAIPP